MVPAMTAGETCGPHLVRARMPSAAAAAQASQVTQDDVDMFQLPPEMLKSWSDLEGVEGVDAIRGPPYVTLDAPEAELLGYPAPAEHASVPVVDPASAAATAGQHQCPLGPEEEVATLTLKPLEASIPSADVSPRGVQR